MNEQVNKLKLEGKIYVWKYLENSRNYPGWNFTTDKIGGEYLLDLIQIMKTCEWSPKKSIQITEPNQKQLNFPNNRNGKAKLKSVQTLTLNHKKDIEPEYWRIIEKQDEIEIVLGKSKLIKLDNSICRILNSDGDFVISDDIDENILYFWWNIDN